MVPGFLFGFEVGVAANMVGKVTGSMISFFIARIFRDRVDAWGQKHRAYRLIAKSVDRGGFFGLCLVRLMYMPMPLKNYGLGALGAPASQTFVASILCAFPFAVMWTWAGSQCKDLAEVFANKDSAKKLPDPKWIPVVLIVLVGVYFARKLVYKMLPDWVKEELESPDVRKSVVGIDKKD